jgi:hypothetical protein
MNISRFFQVSAILVAGVLSPIQLSAATLVQFNSLTPLVSGDGSIKWIGTSQQRVTVDTVEGYGLASMNGGNPTVMSIPAFEPNEGFLFNTGLSTGNGGGVYTNQYTMIFDIYWETSSPWSSLYNAEGLNVNDADFFRRGSDGAIGIGNGGYYGSAEIGKWHRIAFTVTNTDDTTTTISIYLNGSYLGDSVRLGGTDERFSLYLSEGGNQTALFTDNDGETGAAYISQFYFDDRVYTPFEIASLGGASALAIPEPMTTGLFLAGAIGLIGFRRRLKQVRY